MPIVILGMVFCLLLPGQSEVPPDYAAFRAASALKDPAERAVALETFVKNFPGSSRTGTARREILNLHLAKDPQKAVDAMVGLVEGLPPIDASGLYRHLATNLTIKKVLPAAAEQAARQAVSLFTEQAFAESARTEATQFKRPEPSATQISARYRSQLAATQETLALCLVENKSEKEAVGLLEQLLQANPSLYASATALAQHYDRQGNQARALPLFAQAYLAKPFADAREDFDEAWTKSARPAAEKQAYLDQRYHEVFPNPIHPTKYVPSPNRSNRVALAEVYTGAGCNPCAGADVAFDAVLERYSRADVAVVMYHEHIPAPDPMANTGTVTRWKWQKGRGVPTYAIDGVPVNFGGGNRDGSVEIEALVRAAIDKSLDAPAGAILKLSASGDGRRVGTTLVASKIRKGSADLAVHLLLLEKQIRYSGENTIRFHPMVVRAIRSQPVGGRVRLTIKHSFEIEQVVASLKAHIAAFEKYDERHNKDGKFRFTTDLTAINPGNLAVAAFIQDTQTKEVLQAAYAEVSR